MIWTFLLGCPKAPLPIVVDWTEAPHLPAPTAGTYALAPGHPEDRGVASLMVGKRWDASLAGAAAAIALDIVNGEGELSTPELRDAAFRAGWPYPITAAQVWVGKANEPPPDAVSIWAKTVPGDVTVGLVRARGTLDEVWVALVAKPRLDIGVFPRQVPLGGTFTIPALPGAEVWVSDAYGRLDHGPLNVPFTRTAEIEGEWLVEIRDGEGPIATFPVYVGMVAPDLGLLLPTPLPDTWQEADRAMLSLLDEIRDAYGCRSYQLDDPLLQAAARSAADDPTIGTKVMAPQVGMRQDHLWRWECHAATIEGCLDAILWDVRARPGLLAEHALLGRVVELTTTGVRGVFVVGEE